ncbi:hypothetical protein AMTRI_Chr01g109780 [Amborella trichopoda]|uniref:DUF1264 domain-containing protein n=1 Tax=Amborella trichopoda TaxID=13333 RepID=W1PNF8_AMBTC|nr:oil body-associated protein 2B [Amborella trichopoda]ERN09339.1 hypothetical protein AMTR_s00162p00030050 [Amborella trichopoda]|eukprot:XP_020524896.1 oil body-associated protein 2B [Amborella trichopoda]
MASSDMPRRTMPAGDVPIPGEPLSVESQVLERGAQMLQSLKPVKQIQQHVCSFRLYSHDLTRQIRAHHYVARVNQDFLQCAVYDSDSSDARLIGVEYIVSDRIFESLPDEEKKLWHSHAYGIKTGLWVNPRVPEMLQKAELREMAKTHGKFWCTWQVDRGDRLPMGAPALMMSPQAMNAGLVKPELVKERDEKYGLSSEELKESRKEIEEPEWIHPLADYWKQHPKGFATDIVEADMVTMPGQPTPTKPAGMALV